MIVVDTSAVVAILLREPEADLFAKFIEDNDSLISAGSMTELMAVMIAKRGVTGGADIWRFAEAFRLRVVGVTEAQIHLAEEGMARFGKGRGSPPAALNFGDLFAYALARHVEAPLLFKGNDFSQTDITPALPLA
jgi:ribonuclease VapC